SAACTRASKAARRGTGRAAAWRRATTLPSGAGTCPSSAHSSAQDCCTISLPPPSPRGAPDMPQPRSLIDVNAAVGPWPNGDCEALDASSLLSRMDALGIGRALVQHTVAETYEAA